jgi:cytochrome c-type biogenesis protein CcmE
VLKKRKFLIGGFIVLIAIAYLTFMGFSSSATYYYEVGELLAQGSSVYGENVRVNGQVAPGSVEQEAAGRKLRFTIMDIEGKGDLPVFYQGVVPDSFKVGAEVVVEGKLNPDGTFQAGTLMPKCPSKYLPAE